MVNKSLYVYIDEYGTPALEIAKDGTAPYFIYAAVVIDANEVENARTVVNKLYDKYFHQRYIKSSRINNDEKGYNLTINTLTELENLKHYVLTLVVDKSNLSGDGFTYKRSFIKFFQRILSHKLLQSYDEIHVYFDKTGSDDFKNSLENFMTEHGVGPNLFSNNSFKVVDDKDEELVQLADFYAGIVGKYYCGKYDKNRADTIHNKFLRSRISIDWFPDDRISFLAATSCFNEQFDEELTSIAIDSAKKYLADHKEDVCGCELIRYVLQETYRNPLRHISSKEIKDNLKKRNIDIGDPINKVADLRNSGVLLISPIGKKGYKFPNNQKELADFFNRLNSNIIPQLKRGFLMNDIIKRKTLARINVLGNIEFEKLASLCDVVQK